MNIINDWLNKNGDKKIAEKVKLILSGVVVPKGTFYCCKHHYHCEGRCDKQCKDCVGNTPQ
jgi:hypothetical protein